MMALAIEEGGKELKEQKGKNGTCNRYLRKDKPPTVRQPPAPEKGKEGSKAENQEEEEEDDAHSSTLERSRSRASASFRTVSQRGTVLSFSMAMIVTRE
jgi:hypothetical protein